MAQAPLIALLTDFGTSDGYVGVMKGVILGIARDVPLVDLSHEVPPQDIANAAWVLDSSWRFFPVGSVFLCVVDPGVGSARRPVALSADGYSFVGPDNGLFSPILATSAVDHACALDRAVYHLPAAPSATFHGRDIFAPCAAHLAAGVPLPDLGTALNPETLERLPPQLATWEGNTLVGHIAHIDHFGNIITTISGPWTERILADPATALHIADTTISERARTFADGPSGRAFLLRDSSGALAIAVRNGSAARALRISTTVPIHITGLARQAP